MKRRRGTQAGNAGGRAVALVLALATGGPAAAATPFEGEWLTGPGARAARAVVEIRPCDDRLCGTIVAVRDREGSDRIGVRLIRDLVPTAAGTVARGDIRPPGTGHWFRVEIEAEGADQLLVAGCLVPGLLCRTQVWTRLAP